MYVHIGIIGRDKTTQLILALFVIISDSVTLGERAYNINFGIPLDLVLSLVGPTIPKLMLEFMLMCWAPCMYYGPVLHSIHLYLVWDTQAEGMSWHGGRLIRPVCYTLGMPWSTTRPPRVRELVSVFG